MSQLPITITGHLVADPIYRIWPGGNCKTSLRVASSRRWLRTDENGNEVWQESDLLFTDVDAWGELGKHAKQSLVKGMPVILVGSLNTSQYTDKDGNNRSVSVLRATHIGLDLNRYVVASVRTDGSQVPEGMDRPILKEPVPDFGPDDPAEQEEQEAAAEES